MKKLILEIAVCAVSLPLFTVAGTCGQSDPAPNLNPRDDAAFVSRVTGVLKGRTWCHKRHSPVGFVLNFYEFGEKIIRIDDEYVSDEGTVIRDVHFTGFWSLESLGGSRVKIKFSISDTTDPDAPVPGNLELRFTDDNNFKYSNGDTLQPQRNESVRLCL